jgi:hypothetical protein
MAEKRITPTPARDSFPAREADHAEQPTPPQLSPVAVSLALLLTETQKPEDGGESVEVERSVRSCLCLVDVARPNESLCLVPARDGRPLWVALADCRINA